MRILSCCWPKGRSASGSGLWLGVTPCPGGGPQAAEAKADGGPEARRAVGSGQEAAEPPGERLNISIFCPLSPSLKPLPFCISPLCTPPYMCCMHDHQMSSAASSTVDFLCIGLVLMDTRLKLLEDAAEESRDQMSSVFINLEQCFDYLRKLQVTP